MGDTVDHDDPAILEEQVKREERSLSLAPDRLPGLVWSGRIHAVVKRSPRHPSEKEVAL